MNLENTPKELASPEPDIRRAEIEKLINSASINSGIIDVLIVGLSDVDSGIKDICSFALTGDIENFETEVAQKVSTLICQTNIETRNLAGDILINIGHHSVEPLLPYLKHEDIDVRKYACDILGLVGSKEIHEELFPLLYDVDTNVVLSAIESLGNIGDDNAIDKLIELFDSPEELKPNIIDSLGKIGGKKSQDFIIETLKTEEDFFTKISCIDALAICGNEMEICYDLFNELEDANEEIQTIILKTIYAIIYRLDQEMVIPSNYRYISYKALLEDDEDMRIAGLISLGHKYIYEDILALVNEIEKVDETTTELIISNLIENSDPPVIREFLKKSLQSNKFSHAITEFIYTFVSIAERNKNKFKKSYEILVKVIIEHYQNNVTEIFDILLNLKRDLTIESLIKLSQSPKLIVANKAKKLLEVDIKQ